MFNVQVFDTKPVDHDTADQQRGAGKDDKTSERSVEGTVELHARRLVGPSRKSAVPAEGTAFGRSY